MLEQFGRTMQIGYPFQIDGRGRVADATPEQHIRQMIEQVLFTLPGERVNRPDFGSGVQQLIFAPNSEELAAATEFLVKGSLEQWLGEVIEVEAVEVQNEDASLQITVQYRVRRTQERQVVEFSRNG
ncbi:GPW/gp25 family protein [Nostoc sp. MG11]|nr:GPW/gp25 family protein [Nostoc sp. MG11]